MVISFFYCWMHMLLQYYIIHVIVNAVLRLEMCLRQGLFLQSARFCWSFWSWVPDNQSLTFFSSGLWHFTICRCWNNIWVWWIRDCLTVIVSFHSVVLSTIHVRFLPLKIFGVTAVFVSSHVAFYFFSGFFFVNYLFILYVWVGIVSNWYLFVDWETFEYNFVVQPSLEGLFGSLRLQFDFSEPLKHSA